MSKNAELICERCGYCCSSAFFVLSDQDTEDKKELGRWFSYHHCDVMPYPTPNGDRLGIRIPLVCKYLSFDKEKGVYQCTIYDERPLVCREYFCKRMKDQLAIKLGHELLRE